MKRYVLIAELEEGSSKLGYVLGYFKTLEIAKQKHKEYWELINFTKEPLNELFLFHVDDVNSMKDGMLYGKTNGFFNVYIIVDSTIKPNDKSVIQFNSVN